MRKTRLVSALVLASGLLFASDAQAQLGNFCGNTFPTACAEMLQVIFDGDELTIVMSNTTASADHPDATINWILLGFAGGPPPAVFGGADLVEVFYGTWDGASFTPGTSEFWRLTEDPGGAGGVGQHADGVRYIRGDRG